VQVLFADGLADPGELAPHLSGADEVRALAAEFTPEAVTAYCDVPADEIRTLARDLAAADRAASTGGWAAQPSSSAPCQLAGRRAQRAHRESGPAGGAMFPLSATARAPGCAPGQGFVTGRWHSRVAGHPRSRANCRSRLAEEIDTPGEAGCAP